MAVFIPHSDDYPFSNLFHSVRRLERLLDLSYPYNSCKAYAPYGKYAPHCSRGVNRNNMAQVPGLLEQLCRTPFPSSRAGKLLEDLSRCAVCGITGWHMPEAPKTYEKWCRLLWQEYLRVHDVDSNLIHTRVPHRLSSSTWVDALVALLPPLEADLESEEEFTDNEEEITELLNDDDGNDESEDVATPDTTYSLDDDEFEFDDPSSDSGSTPKSTTVESIGSSSQETPQVVLPSDVNEPSHDNENSSDDEAFHTPDSSDTASEGDHDTSDDIIAQQDGLVASAEEATALSEFLAIDDTLFSEPSPDSSSPLPPSTLIHLPRSFTLYSQAPTPVAQLKQLLHSMSQIVAPGRRSGGYIYAFTRPSLPGFLKIGYVQDVTVPGRPYPDPVDHRLASWRATCGHPVEEAFRVRVPAAAERVEGLVHQSLRGARRVEACGRCGRRLRRGRSGGGQHDEWFEVAAARARAVVDAWALWAGCLPYDRFGRLVDFWAEKIDGEKARVGEGDSVAGWLEGMTGMVEEMRRWEFGNIIGTLGRVVL
jgi:hypothetical protein